MIWWGCISFAFFFSCKNVLGVGLLLLSVKHLPTSQHLILVLLLIKITEIKAFAICYFGYPTYYSKTIWLGYLYFEKHDFHSLHFCNSGIIPKFVPVKCILQYFLRTLRHILQKPQGIYTVKTFRKTWVGKKNGSSSLKQCNFSPKENKKQNKTKAKNWKTNKQIKTRMNTTFHIVINVWKLMKWVLHIHFLRF